MIRYSEKVIGTIVIVQNREDEAHKFEIQIRQGNCLAVFLYVYKENHPSNPKKPYVHQLVNFLADTQHLRNIIKSQKKDVFAYLLSADAIESIRLNLFLQRKQ